MPRRRPRRVKRRARGNYLTDTATGCLEPNTYAQLTLGMTKLPTNRPFKIQSVRVEVAADNPATVQVGIMNQYGSIVATSGPRLTGTSVVYFTVNNAHNELMFPTGMGQDTVLAKIQRVCDRKGEKGQLSYVIHIRILLGPELLPATCPSLRCIPLGNDDSTDGFDTCLSE